MVRDIAEWRVGHSFHPPRRMPRPEISMQRYPYPKSMSSPAHPSPHLTRMSSATEGRVGVLAHRSVIPRAPASSDGGRVRPPYKCDWFKRDNPGNLSRLLVIYGVHSFLSFLKLTLPRQTTGRPIRCKYRVL